jgi:hypothetical protein
MFGEEDDVFGFKSFDETFEEIDKLKILEKYSTQRELKINKEIVNVQLYCNFQLLGDCTFLLGEMGVSVIMKNNATFLFSNIQEISIKKDPEFIQDELLNLKLESTVYVQFKFTKQDLVFVKNYFLIADNSSPKEEVVITEIKRDLKEFESRCQRIIAKKYQLEQEIKELDLELQNLQKEYFKQECGLCCDSLVDKIFKPCGHVICGSCLEKLKESENIICPWDRIKVSLIQEIS